MVVLSQCVDKNGCSPSPASSGRGGWGVRERVFQSNEPVQLSARGIHLLLNNLPLAKSQSPVAYSQLNLRALRALRGSKLAPDAYATTTVSTPSKKPFRSVMRTRPTCGAANEAALTTEV